jgi:(p)ppGpp synthase/HD superfamily hydrolase
VTGGQANLADTKVTPVPGFVRRSNLLRGAHEFARWSHHGPRREGDTDIDHPTAVAALLAEAGFDEQVVAAALLHDVLEDTASTEMEIRSRFGPAVGDLVAEMTENEGIRDYRERKAEHRGRVARHRRVAAIYAADKLANARARDGAQIPAKQLDHYVRTVQGLSRAHPELPFLTPLRQELERLLAERAAA